VHYLSANPFDGARRSFLATQTEGKSEAKRYRNDDTREERLHELRRDTELVQHSEDSGYPNRVFGDRAGKIDCCYFGMAEDEEDLTVFYIDQLAKKTRLRKNINLLKKSKISTRQGF